MSQLHTGHGSLARKKSHDSRQKLDVRIVPDSQIFRADASFGRHAGGFGKDQARSSHCTAPQMYEVPIVGEAVLAGIFAHRRDDNAIRQRDSSNLKWIE